MKDRTALVVGGSGGIGRSCAVELLRTGWDVVLVARNEDRLRAAAAEAGTDRWMAVDIADPAGAAEVAAALDTLDLVVLAAGEVAPPTALVEENTETFERLFRANLLSVVVILQAILPRIAPGGRVVFVSSTSARGLAKSAAYAASKAGMSAVAATLAREVASEEVNVSVVTPGPVDTGMMSGWPAGIPLLEPHDVARTISYLAELPPSVRVDEIILTATNRRESTSA